MTAVSDPRSPNAFDVVVAMAEAAHFDNMSWWNEIRSGAADPVEVEYCASKVLAQIITTSAFRNGTPAVDVWRQIRKTGELPL
jgi:hypothetical protein